MENISTSLKMSGQTRKDVVRVVYIYLLILTVFVAPWCIRAEYPLVFVRDYHGQKKNPHKRSEKQQKHYQKISKHQQRSNYSKLSKR